MDYADFRACERSGTPFPGTMGRPWDELDDWTQLMLVAYNQIRCIEEAEER